MVNEIVDLENDKSYVLLEETVLDNVKYYYGLRLNENNEPTNNYLFFQEISKDDDVFLLPVIKDNLRSLLFTAFTINFLEKVYDEI